MSNALHAPSGDKNPWRFKLKLYGGSNIKLVPPTIAESHSPLRMAFTAWYTAQSDDEHAESIAKLGPLKSNVYEILFGNIAL